MLKVKAVLLILLVFFLVSACAKEKSTLIIFHAGSLSVPLKDMTAAFNQTYPHVDVIREASGSRICARKISDLGKTADIMFSADSSVIQTLLIPDHADWNINFATNEMALVFTSKSKYADEINAKNWPQILLRPDVSYGHSDPNADPCGYRSQLTWQLSEKYYEIPNLYLRLKDKKHFVRPKETDLLALLESYNMDYLFLYRSVAQQHHLKYILLPDQVNLKTKQFADFYQTASIKVTGKKPGEYVTKKGKPMVYGMTIPKNAQNKEMALEYVKLVISKQGQDIMAKNGQPAINPATSDEKEKLPEGLRELVF